MSDAPSSSWTPATAAPSSAPPLFPSFFPDGRLSLPPSPLASFHNFAPLEVPRSYYTHLEASVRQNSKSSTSQVLSPSCAFPALPSDPSSCSQKKKSTSRSSGVVRLTAKQRQDLDDVEKGTHVFSFSASLPSRLLLDLYDSFLSSRFSFFRPFIKGEAMDCPRGELSSLSLFFRILVFILVFVL